MRSSFLPTLFTLSDFSFAAESAQPSALNSFGPSWCATPFVSGWSGQLEPYEFKAIDVNRAHGQGFRSLYHVFAPSPESADGAAKMSLLIQNILFDSDARGYKSIMIPLVGVDESYAADTFVDLVRAILPGAVPRLSNLQDIRIGFLDNAQQRAACDRLRAFLFGLLAASGDATNCSSARR